MEKDFEIELEQEIEEPEIELEEPQEPAAGGVQLPLNFLSFGELEPTDVKVYIKQGVYKALEKYSAADTANERGTILLGDYCEELGKTHVIISDYIEAKYTDASASTLTFTHETWDYVHKKKEEKFPDQKIIGWQHTHPNYGIFLSNYDLFIQENFFDMPFQVAYVIDPIQNLRGFFQWKDGKIEKLKGYYIYDEVGKPIKIEQKKLPDPKEKSAKASGWVLTLLCLLIAGLGVLSLVLGGQYRAKLKDLYALLSVQDQTIAQQAQEITALQDQWVQSVLDPANGATVDALIQKIELGEILVDNKEETLRLLRALADAFGEGDQAVRFVAYTVREEDCLTTICADHNLDYETYKGLLLSINRISDPDIIQTGRTLLIPILPE